MVTSVLFWALNSVQWTEENQFVNSNSAIDDQEYVHISTDRTDRRTSFLSANTLIYGGPSTVWAPVFCWLLVSPMITTTIHVQFNYFPDQTTYLGLRGVCLHTREIAWARVFHSYLRKRARNKPTTSWRLCLSLKIPNRSSLLMNAKRTPQKLCTPNQISCMQPGENRQIAYNNQTAEHGLFGVIISSWVQEDKRFETVGKSSGFQ